jgi:hypothetical protein
VGFTHSGDEAPLVKKNNERKADKHNCEIKRKGKRQRQRNRHANDPTTYIRPKGRCQQYKTIDKMRFVIMRI